MEKILGFKISKRLRYGLAMLIVPAASPMVVYTLQSMTSIASSTLGPLLITLLTIAYAWCIWTIGSSTESSMSLAEETAYQIEALNAHSIVTMANKQGCLTYANDKFLETTGYLRSELMGKTIAIFYPKSEEALFREVRKTVLSGNRWTGEMQVKSKDDRNIWTHATIVPQIDKYKNVIGSISIRTDITQSKAAAAGKNLRKSLHLLRDEVYMFEPDTLRFIYLNLAAMKQCGWNEAAYLQKTLFDTPIEFNGRENKDISAFNSRVQALIDGEVEELAFELPFRGKLNEVKLQLIFPEGGKPHYVAMARDISERRVLEKSKDDFISTVSHELRTPVTSIKGALGLILSGAAGRLDDKAHGMLDIAYRNTDRLALIINDILDLEKIAAGRMEFNLEPVNLATLLTDAIAANEPYGDRFGVSIIGSGLDQNIEGHCDSDRVFQVMNNLLSNAAKFSKPGGKVIVTLSETSKNICISVEDFGVGIPEIAQSNIFDRFTQANCADRRALGGTGLGLSIVKALVESQGGTISFESLIGKGTKFSFELPKSGNGVTKFVNEDIKVAAE